MSKIIILCWGYDGDNSMNANAICTNNIIVKTRFKNDIIVITGGLDIDQEKLIINGVEVYNIHQINQSIKKELSNYKVNAMRIVNEIFKKESIKIVFAVSFQFINLDIGRMIITKYKDIKLFAYELDPYAYNEALRLPVIGFPYRYLKEKRNFLIADRIFLTHELFKLYKTNLFNEFDEKFIRLGIPMLDIRDNYQTKKNSNDCKIVYTGTFSKQYRDPTFMLKLFTSIKNMNNWSLHIFGVDIRDIDECFLNELQGKLFVYGKLPRNEILEKMKEASVFINISNTMSNQLPSKLLDYIGFRKPIINIFKNENDICNEYLFNYPIKLLIKEDYQQIKNDAINLMNFIDTNKNTICSYDEVRANYYEYSIEAIVEKLDDFFCC